MSSPCKAAPRTSCSGSDAETAPLSCAARPAITMNGNETVRREAKILAALATTDVPHPKLIAACPSEDILGAAFLSHGSG